VGRARLVPFLHTLCVRERLRTDAHVCVCVQNIVLSGGSTLFKDFNRRLQRDIKRIVDERLLKSEEKAGVKAKAIDVNVIAHQFQRYAVWFGGSMIAMMVRSL